MTEAAALITLSNTCNTGNTVCGLELLTSVTSLHTKLAVSRFICFLFFPPGLATLLINSRCSLLITHKHSANPLTVSCLCVTSSMTFGSAVCARGARLVLLLTRCTISPRRSSVAMVTELGSFSQPAWNLKDAWVEGENGSRNLVSTQYHVTICTATSPQQSSRPIEDRSKYLRSADRFDHKQW